MKPTKGSLRYFPALVVVLGFWSFWTPPASAQIYILGRTESVVVPAVVESWSATAASIPPQPEHRLLHHIGHFPGFREAKRQANELRRRIGSQPRQIPAQAATQAGVATPAAGALATTSGSGIVFDGPSESDTQFIPPDPVVAAGPNNIVVLINSLMAVYDKSGNLQGGFQPLSTFFAGLGIAGQIFDPRIIYDQTDNRFILTAAEVDLTNFTNGNVFIAVSQTADPTGAWNKYAVNFKGRNLSGTADTFPDFPTLGLSSAAVYISTGQFELNTNCESADSCSFSDTWIKVIGLTELLSGNPALYITTFQNVKTTSGLPAFAVEPAVTYGSSPSEFLVATDFSSNPGSVVNVFSVNTSGTPVLSAANLTVPSFSLPPDATQPTNLPIATNDFRMLNAVWSNGSLWCGQNVAGTNGNTVARWYQIAVTSLLSLSLVESGDISGTGDAYFPAVAVTSKGDAEVVFTTSSVLDYASAAFAGRSASDTANSMRTFVVYRQGTGIYSEPSALRWGDYSAASLDTDGASIWTIAEFAASPDPRFGTAVAQVTTVSPYTVSSARLDFGNQLVGYPSSPQNLTLTNSSAGSITVTPLAIGGPNASDFALTGDQCSNATLASGASCTVTLTFTPATTGFRSAVVTVATGPGSSAVYVQLAGTGIPVSGALLLQPSALAFPDTPVRYASASQNLTLKNISNVSVLIDQIAFGPGGGFAQTNNCGASLAAGASCTIAVTFRPSYPGPYPQTLRVYSGTGSASAAVSGNGTTVPVVTPCPAAVSFSNQVVGTTSAPMTVTVTNTGTGTLTITAMTASGDFAQSNSCPKTLAARTACNISVTFAPATTGVRNGTLTILDNAAGSPHSISLAGTGVATAASNRSSPENRSATQGLDPGTRLAAAASPPAERGASAQAIRDYGRLPLTFEPNEGQADSIVRFLSRGGGYTLFLTPDEAVLKLTRILSSKVKDREAKPSRAMLDRLARPATDRRRTIVDVLCMRLVGANPAAIVEGLDPSHGTTNYFIGNDPARWRTQVASYARVRYAGIYPGVDLVYYGNQRQLEYDFVVAPGANPSQIALEIASGMTKFGTTPPQERSGLQVDPRGDLVIRTAAGEMRLHKPIVYQIRSGAKITAETDGPDARRSPDRKFLKAGYMLHPGGKVSFRIPVYDHARPLVIDPPDHVFHVPRRQRAGDRVRNRRGWSGQRLRHRVHSLP